MKMHSVATSKNGSVIIGRNPCLCKLTDSSFGLVTIYIINKVADIGDDNRG